MIAAGSRYASSQVITAVKDGAEVQVITPSQAVAYTFSYSEYQWTDADRLDTLAQTRYGDPSKWWQIADGNPEILDWTQIRPGTIIRIPFA